MTGLTLSSFLQPFLPQLLPFCRILTVQLHIAVHMSNHSPAPHLKTSMYQQLVLLLVADLIAKIACKLVKHELMPETVARQWRNVSPKSLAHLSTYCFFPCQLVRPLLLFPLPPCLAEAMCYIKGPSQAV